ncbi:hypothetical protein PCC9214_01168 [Planktothrix tepida]|uniref:AlgX/AlgJ SGNH hydrolase-like domain-containing protein n=1 Tax=Planktothrix tepida PCC 9214 TaxID=671072 RepID=A0A1J1LHF7_9CYAN|nr:hypothetical protein [Planktothrix tepida]CAD5929212.1 hypothetical protein PCC9214_01168 [Planktothrix tepida]CUR31466.1 hypothetical protein PL9214291057 [Planktothrix tepida PCC 9214]
MIKTLIGKSGYLFLNNDSNSEIQKHSQNIGNISNNLLDKYKHLNKYYLFVYPDKSVQCQKYLPDNVKILYRNEIDKYKEKLGDRVIDLYEILKHEEDVYYKTDTHINRKGNLIVFDFFCDYIQKKLEITINKPKIKLIKQPNVILSELGLGLGDLTWDTNKGDLLLEDIKDDFYFYEGILPIYNKYVFKDNDDLRLIEIKDKSLHEVILVGKVLNWSIISRYILYKKNGQANNNLKILIFYDSFLSNMLELILPLFSEIYLIKSTYTNDMTEIINPDFVFEFKIERFLN